MTLNAAADPDRARAEHDRRASIWLRRLLVPKAVVWLLAGIAVLMEVDAWRVVLAGLAFAWVGACVVGVAWITDRLRRETTNDAPASSPDPR